MYSCEQTYVTVALLVGMSNQQKSKIDEKILDKKTNVRQKSILAQLEDRFFFFSQWAPKLSAQPAV